MKNKGYKVFSVISLLVPVIYFISNSIMILLLNVSSANKSIINTVFAVDVLTWHIYGIFAIATLIIKYIKDKKYNASTILHAIFMIISFVEIHYLLSRGF